MTNLHPFPCQLISIRFLSDHIVMTFHGTCSHLKPSCSVTNGWAINWLSPLLEHQLHDIGNLLCLFQCPAHSRSSIYSCWTNEQINVPLTNQSISELGRAFLIIWFDDTKTKRWWNWFAHVYRASKWMGPGLPIHALASRHHACMA